MFEIEHFKFNVSHHVHENFDSKFGPDYTFIFEARTSSN